MSDTPDQDRHDRRDERRDEREDRRDDREDTRDDREDRRDERHDQRHHDTPERPAPTHTATRPDDEWTFDQVPPDPGLEVTGLALPDRVLAALAIQHIADGTRSGLAPVAKLQDRIISAMLN